MAGMTTRVSSVEDTMPPIMGTAMRCITSEPTPVLRRIGTSPESREGSGEEAGPSWKKVERARSR